MTFSVPLCDFQDEVWPVERDAEVIQDIAAQQHVGLFAASESFDGDRRQAAHGQLYQKRRNRGQMPAEFEPGEREQMAAELEELNRASPAALSGIEDGQG
jgi:hypothetical protein